MFENMKMGTKTIGALMIIVVIALAIGVTGIININKIVAGDSLLYEKRTVPLAIMGKLSTNFERMRVYMVAMLLLADTAQERQRYGGLVKETANDINKLIPEYEKTFFDANDKKNFDDLKIKYDEYAKVCDQAIELVRFNRKNEASAMYFGDIQKVILPTEAIIIKTVDDNVQNAKEQNDDNSKTAAAAIRTMTAFIIIGLLIAIGLGLLLRKNVANIIRGILDEIKLLTDSAVNGKLNARAVIEKINHEFRLIGAGFNDVLDALTKPLNIAVDCIDKISAGNIPPKITETVSGDFNILKNNLNKCIDAVNALVADANMLSASAVEGKLATRADAARHQGDFQKIIKGVNDTLDAVIGPLNVAAHYVDRISKGEMPPQITEQYNGDFNTIKNNLNLLIESLNQVTNVAENISNGNLLVTIEERSEKDALMKTLKLTVENLTTFAVNVQTAAEQVASGSNQLSTSAEQMSQGATEQASSIEEVTSSMEEMNSSIVQNADNAKQTSAISEKAAGDAMDGGKAVVEAVNAMKMIAEKISVIQAIAGQTNMLALNAAIEAARAGEHGKGFAVVAAEVRNLAERSQTAAKEISELSQSSVGISEKAGNLMEAMMPQIKKTSELVFEINTSSAEQARGIEQVTKAIEQLDKVIQENAAATEEMASTSVELAGQSDQLRKSAAFFKIAAQAAGTIRATGQEHGKNTAMKKIVRDKSAIERSAKSGLTKNTGVEIDMDIEDDKHFDRV